MERIIRLFQGVTMVALLAAIVTGYRAVDAAAAAIQSCDDDPYCHSEFRGDDLRPNKPPCRLATCDSSQNVCCLEEIEIGVS